MTSNSTENRQIVKFGIIALIFFGFLFTLGLWLDKPLAICLFGTLSFLGLGFALIPKPLRPIYVGWLNTAHFIGRMFTIVILTLAYYLVITPSGLLKRIFGGRPLSVRPDRHMASYWVDRTEPAQPKERFLKRY